jgi:septal ring factor EnvC (AmiA/AmiB activator)
MKKLYLAACAFITIGSKAGHPDFTNEQKADIALKQIAQIKSELSQKVRESQTVEKQLESHKGDLQKQQLLAQLKREMAQLTQRIQILENSVNALSATIGK